jgi:hypothetical protein
MRLTHLSYEDWLEHAFGREVPTYLWTWQTRQGDTRCLAAGAFGWLPLS